MGGFNRRYPFNPGLDVITQIEGTVIIDLAPPGSIQGVGTGVACVVGEFANMQHAVAVSATGVATTRPTAAEIFSSADLLDKVGGFDELLGAFGVSQGNGFVEIRSKRFARLIVMPVDILTPAAGSQGTVRLWRQLPTNQSATVAQPIVPVSAAVVDASREFRNSGNRARLASRVVFTDQIAYHSGTDGAVTAAGAAVTQSFDSATGDFVNKGVLEGDILVIGVIGGAGALGANADTYRVVSVTDADTIVVEKLDGSSWTWTTGTALPWRLHVGTTADSNAAHNQLSEAAGYSVLARPLDATLTVGLALTPTVVPAAGTATTWDPLSGLTGKVHPSTAVTYDATVHAPNAAVNATIEARYQAALDALMNDDYPARDVNIVTAARKSTTIASALRQHVLNASTRGLTRRTILSPAVNQVTLATVLGAAAPGVGATRSDRVDYAWPGAQVSIPEAVGFSLTTADGRTTVDGILDLTGDTWLMAVESNLPPERNPGQAAAPVPQVLSPVLAFARGTPRLGQPEYVQLRAQGIAALRFDRVAGPIFQSGVTTSLVSGEKNIMRRRMADYIQDSIADRTTQLSKLPLTESLKGDVLAEIDAFLNDLLSPNNPAAQRIDGYSIDGDNGNTPTTNARGVYVVLIAVKLTPTADNFVIQTNIGEGTVISEVIS